MDDGSVKPYAMTDGVMPWLAWAIFWSPKNQANLFKLYEWGISLGRKHIRKRKVGIFHWGKVEESPHFPCGLAQTKATSVLFSIRSCLWLVFGCSYFEFLTISM